MILKQKRERALQQTLHMLKSTGRRKNDFQRRIADVDEPSTKVGRFVFLFLRTCRPTPQQTFWPCIDKYKIVCHLLDDLM